jgi:diacylglycerol kinase family enzyme
MAKITVYYNEKASSFKQFQWLDGIKSALFRHELTLKTPQNLEELNLELISDVKQKVDYIFAIGGDGTTNTIIQKIIGTKIKLMTIPAGTANDFASELGISRDLEKLIKIFQLKTTKNVDALNINGKYMVGNGGIGIAAEVANNINKYRKNMKGFTYLMKKMGANVYPMIFTKEILLKPFVTYKLHLDSPDLPLLNPIVNVPLILVNNQARLGGKFLVAPETVNDDGKFNVTIFLHQNKMDLIKCALKIIQGNLPKDDENLIQFETSRLGIAHLGDHPLSFFGDGEILGHDHNFEIAIKAKALEVCTHHSKTLNCNNYSLAEIEI